MRRREFITLISGAAAWPLVASAQQHERVRRLGVLMSVEEGDAEGKAQLSGFTQALAQLGWTDGQNFGLHANSNAITFAQYRAGKLQNVMTITESPSPVLASNALEKRSQNMD
jgi:putative tryptophan/tyrosine transport system substrate-binding protein